MQGSDAINVRVKISRIGDEGNRYHCAMDMDGDKKPVECDVEFPFGRVELLQPMYELENRGLVNYANPSKLGEQLYDLLFPPELAKRFDAICDESRVSRHIRIVVDSQHSEILSLPWELVMHPTTGYLCLSNNISLVRTLGKEFRQSGHELEAPPLRILMMVSSPDDQLKLDYEREQDVLLKALEEPVRDGLIEVEYCEEGTLEALERQIKDNRYHVIHLSGHGDKGSFIFEDDRYRSDPVDADRLLNAIAGSDSVKLVVLGGCLTSKTDHSALTGMAQKLCGRGVPLVIGFQMSVPDIAATKLMEPLYKRLCQDWELDNALADGRAEVKRWIEKDKEFSKDVIMGLSWAMPTLYASSSLQRVVDFSKQPVQRAEREVDFSTKFGEIEYLKTGFVGRRKDIRACREMLREKPCLYIHGYGGIGKSTLSTRLAERYAREGFNGLFIKGEVRMDYIISQVAVDLLRDDQQEPNRILTSPNVREEDKLKYCISELGRSPYLIIMDNFEDNIDRESLTLADESLEKGLTDLLNGIKDAKTRIIITSRYELKSQRLRSLMGEHNLGEFSFSDALKKMNRLDELRIQPMEVKKGIYDRLGGHPKAIEDISAVLGATPVKWEEIEDKLKGVQDRLQAEFLLLGVLYDYLDDKQRKLLRRASVYTKPVSFNGLQMQVDYDAEGLIPPLVERSLLQWGYDEDGVVVYYVHRITAQFLKGLMPEREWVDANKCAAEHYDYEIKNNNVNAWDYLTAREHYLACGDLKRAAEIAFAFAERLWVWGNYERAMQLNQETLRNAPDELTKAVAGCNIGIIHHQQGRYEDALRYYSDSLQIDQELGDRSGIAASLHQIGMIHEDQGRYEDALRYYDDSLRVRQELGDQSGIAKSFGQMGIVHQRQGRYKDALKYYSDSLKVFQELGDWSGISVLLHQIGNIHYLQSRYEDALRYYSDSLKISQELGDRFGIANSFVQIGNTHHQQGRYEDALRYYSDSLKIRQELGDRSGIAVSLHEIGAIHQRQGRYEDALRYYNDSLKTFQELGDRYGIATSFGRTGLLYFEQSKNEMALRYALRASIIFQSIGSPSVQMARRDMANIREKIGEEKFNTIVQSEMREIEQHGPDVIPEGGEEVEQ